MCGGLAYIATPPGVEMGVWWSRLYIATPPGVEMGVWWSRLYNHSAWGGDGCVVV